MRTVTVLVEGYVKAIEGRQLIPGVSVEWARQDVEMGTVACVNAGRCVRP